MYVAQTYGRRNDLKDMTGQPLAIVTFSVGLHNFQSKSNVTCDPNDHALLKRPDQSNANLLK